MYVRVVNPNAVEVVMRILHVEDIPQMSNIVRRVLSTPTREVVVASNFKEFQKLIARGEGDFDFVISDAHIPMFGGEDARYMAHEIYGEFQRFVRDIPFIFLTGDPDKLSDIPKEVPIFDKLGTWMDAIPPLLAQREREISGL